MCRRAGLRQIPDLYLLPDPKMNAYALGGPAASAIILTDGMLRGMSMPEAAGILAHEIGHILNNDGWAMTLASALSRATQMMSLMARPCLDDEPAVAWTGGALATLLDSAPAIGRLLHMGLSRIREFDADAVAFELVDDPLALVEALHKLEHHHSGVLVTVHHPLDEALLRLLRSHPTTRERVEILLSLSHG
jgi:heat shock protein HtpX